MAEHHTPSRFYSGGGAGLGTSRLSTPSNWVGNSARYRRNTSRMSAPVSSSYGPGDVIDAVGMDSLEDNPLVSP